VGPGASSLQRVIVAFAIGAVVGIGLAFVSPWQFAVPAGWSAGHAVFLVVVWLHLRRMSPDEVEAWAAREDDTRATVSALLVGAAVASIVAVAFALRKATQTFGFQEFALTAVALVTVVVS